MQLKTKENNGIRKKISGFPNQVMRDRERERERERE